MVATSTWRYRASIPFTYTLAWYDGSRDNIKKEVTLPRLYEGVVSVPAPAVREASEHEVLSVREMARA